MALEVGRVLQMAFVFRREAGVGVVRPQISSRGLSDPFGNNNKGLARRARRFYLSPLPTPF